MHGLHPGDRAGVSLNLPEIGRWLKRHLTVPYRGADLESWSGIMRELGWAIAFTAVGYVVARSLALLAA